jgi:hypothetical protein
MAALGVEGGAAEALTMTQDAAQLAQALTIENLIVA